MKPTNQQLVSLIAEIESMGYFVGLSETPDLPVNPVTAAKAILSASRKIALQEPTDEEIRDAAYEAPMTPTLTQVEWNRKVIRTLFDRRLKSLAAKTDRAVETVRKIGVQVCWTTADPIQRLTEQTAEQIVAAVRKADKEASNA